MKNNSSFGGVLQPLVELLENKSRVGQKLIGQEVVLSRKDIRVIIALDSENDVHLLITPATKDDSRLSKLDLKGMKIINREWSVSDQPVQKYLDISCSTGTLPLFKRPFLRFAEDVLYEISESNLLPSDAVYKTSFRWRKFWSLDINTEVTREWVHGLFGELLFLTDIIERFGSPVVNSWKGPLANDHDFQTGRDLAVEVKTSVGVPFSINCNLQQLDTDLFEQLYIICYQLTPAEEGTTLSKLVRHIEQLMKNEEILLDKFYALLMATGYTVQLESVYNEFILNYSQAVVFPVNNDFPRIVEKSFISPPDHRITGMRYTLHLTGLKEERIEDIEDKLELLKK